MRQQPRLHVFQNAATGTGVGTELEVTAIKNGAYPSLMLQVEGITTATITMQATIDDSTWYAVRATNVNTGVTATTITADGLYAINTSGHTKVRANITAHSSGTITAQGWFIREPGVFMDASVQPFRAVQELGVTELIGVDEQVDQNDFCASLSVTIDGSGYFNSFAFYTTEDDSGGIRTPTGKLFLFDADPSVPNGATTLGAAVYPTIIGSVDLASGDWQHNDANGAIAVVYDQIPFHHVSDLYFSFKLTSATSFNDGATDDEQLRFNAWYELWS